MAGVRIKQHPMYLIYPNGQIWSLRGKIFLKPLASGKGYFSVKLNNRRKYIHRLVALTFLGYQRGKEVNHKDGNKRNNSVENLEWVSHVENMHHAKDTGKMLRGEKIMQAKLSSVQVKEIKSLIREGIKNQRQIARQFNVHYVTINDIKAGRSWKHIV